jgi:hypothetical protein
MIALLQLLLDLAVVAAAAAALAVWQCIAVGGARQQLL